MCLYFSAAVVNDLPLCLIYLCPMVLGLFVPYGSWSICDLWSLVYLCPMVLGLFVPYGPWSICALWSLVYLCPMVLGLFVDQLYNAIRRVCRVVGKTLASS